MAYEAVIFNTDGSAMKVTGTISATAITVHTAHATSLDEVTLYAWNSAATAKLLTLEIGGSTDPDKIIEVQLEPNTAGLQCVLPSIRVTGSITIEAFAETADVITLYATINRIG